MMNKLFILFYMWRVGFGFEGSLILKELGEKQFTLLKGKSNSPIHGTCWHSTLKMLENNCNNLNDHEHSLLALRLANCFLQDSGHITYDCDLRETETTRRKCINEMSDRAFGVYNEFYTHTTTICFYLKHEIWQSETEQTIKILYQASSTMIEQLVTASKMQGSMLESQKEGLRLQNELLNHGKELGDVIKSSAHTVNSMVSDFKETSNDQRALLHEIFSYLRTFQDWIIGQVSWLQSILYYTGACIICALFSSSKRTADARVTLFTILSINVTIERMLMQYIYSTKEGVTESTVHIMCWTWYLRKGALLLCVIVLLYSYYTYTDEHREQYKILKRIEKDIHMLQENSSTFRYRTRLAIKRLQTSRSSETEVPIYLDTSKTK